jgi:gamma-polyglutamate biosynthesis protein CapA
MLKISFVAVLLWFVAGCAHYHVPLDEERCLTIMAAGDILLDRGVKKAIFLHDDPGYPMRDLPVLFEGADIAMANLECALTDQTVGYGKVFSFRGDPSLAGFLGRSGINVLSLANNHGYDFGRDGLLETIQHLESNGITPVGAGENLAQAARPRFFRVNGMTIAILGFVSLPLEAIVWQPDKPSPAAAVDAVVAEAIEQARMNADIVIVTVHWGTEFQHVPDSGQLRWASFFREHGADLVFGHHPHVIQPAEEMNGKWTFYSLGNFIFDQRKEPRNLAMVARIRVCEGEIRQVSAVPVEIIEARPSHAKGPATAKILRILREYSSGVDYRLEGDDISIQAGMEPSAEVKNPVEEPDNAVVQ